MSETTDTTVIATMEDMAAWLYRSVSTELSSVVSGGVYREQLRPAGSTSEDVCVNVQAFNADERPYTAYVNVNAYVPYIHVKNAHGSQQGVPNYARCKELLSVMDTWARAACTQDVCLRVERHSLLEYADVGQTCCNILLYCFINQ